MQRGEYMNFEIIQNDITNMTVSAIVLPANEKLKEGSGASKAIFEKAGRKLLTQACKELGSCKTGEAVPTLAYHLHAEYIIHTVVPKWIDGEHQEYEFLSAAYLSALNIADVLGCTSIAFPLLSSGNNGFDLNLAFEIAKSSIESFEGINLKKIFLVVYGDTIATFIKGKGYSVVNLQNVPQIDREKEDKKKVQQLKKDSKQIVQKALEQQLEKAIEYLKDENNLKKIIQTGFFIASQVLQITKKPRKPK